MMDLDKAEKLRLEIIVAEKEILEKKKQLFKYRLFRILNEVGSDINTIKEINFDMDINDLSDWSISYIHKTSSYDENNYVYNNDSELETEPFEKTTSISFGKSKKYFIRGNHGNRIKIYRNSKNELRIINTDYDIELDLTEQAELIEKYSMITDMPEWLAIKIFLYMAKNDWDDENIVSYLSIV